MKSYDLAFGCGFSCGVTSALREAGLQFASFPFDWTATPSFIKAAKTIAEGFDHWLEKEDLELVDVKHSGINKRIYANRRTGFGFVHDFSLFLTADAAYEAEKKKYMRRIERLENSLSASARVLSVAAECPLLSPLKMETLKETKRIFETRFPNTVFDLLYFHAVDGATKAHVESENDGITVVGCEYRKYMPDGALHHEIDNSQIAAFLKANYSVEDLRSPEKKAQYEINHRKQHAGRWHGRNIIENFINKTAFRQYRRLEKFLVRKGLMPPERPLWFVTKDEPR